MNHKLDILGDETQRRWDTHFNLWRGCTRCEIGITCRKHVFARGTIPCDVLFVGEAPGPTEDLIGFPFIGRAGRLLDKWLAHAWGEVYSNGGDVSFAVTNVVLCIPKDGHGARFRAPSGTEIANCHERLTDFVKNIAKPKAIVTLGKPAAAHCPRYGLPTLELGHPSWVLRSSGVDSPLDLQQRNKLCQFLSEYVFSTTGSSVGTAPAVESPDTQRPD